MRDCSSPWLRYYFQCSEMVKLNHFMWCHTLQQTTGCSGTQNKKIVVSRRASSPWVVFSCSFFLFERSTGSYTTIQSQKGFHLWSLHLSNAFIVRPKIRILGVVRFTCWKRFLNGYYYFRWCLKQLALIQFFYSMESRRFAPRPCLGSCD